MLLFLIILAVAEQVYSHGRVLEPPSRASAWRYGFPTSPNYDDDGVNCGGFYYQWSVNNGKCGICGDAYDLREPRPHELGGVFGDGVIVHTYMPGAVISTTVELTAYHRGYWQFKLCPDPKRNDQACFDDYPLELEEGGTHYYPTKGSTKYEVSYRLPQGLICEHCVLQWRYTAGNNWGDCKNGTQGLGCGNQEEFGACSDISIGTSRDHNLVEPVQSEYGEIPYPLLYYLKNGYFDAQQGILHLLRTTPVRRRTHKPHRQRQNSKFTKRKRGKKKPRKRKKVRSPVNATQ